MGGVVDMGVHGQRKERGEGMKFVRYLGERKTFCRGDLSEGQWSERRGRGRRSSSWLLSLATLDEHYASHHEHAEDP